MIDEELIGLFEIAEMANVGPSAVANWRSRFKDFPKPIAELRSGPIFKRSHVRNWLRKRRYKMAHVISFINLKGGVGKTTTSVAAAEFMSALHKKKILFIDLD